MASNRRRSESASNFPAVAAVPTTAGVAELAVPSHGGTRGKAFFAAGIVALLGFIAFANSFFGDFVLDDVYEIEQNPNMNYL